MKKEIIKLLSLTIILIGATACSNKNVPATTNTTPTSTPKTSATYKISDVSKHNTKDDCWMAINGNVYDVSAYIALGQHNPKIINGCGTDATMLFGNVDEHYISKPQAQRVLDQYLIGTIK